MAPIVQTRLEMRHTRLYLLTWLFGAWGCDAQSESPSCERGTESCECLSSGGCDKGLTCLSNVCVDERTRATERDDSNDAGSSDPETTDESSTSDSTTDEESSDNESSGSDTDASASDDTPSNADGTDTSSDELATDAPAESDPSTPDEVPTDDPGTDAGDAVTDVAATDDAPATDPADTPDTPASETQKELSDGSLGSSCGECDGFWECDTSAPGGYCTSICFAPEDCPGGACYTVGGGTACLLSCKSDADCRPGYSCTGLSDSPVCFPGEAMPVGCSNACVHYLTCQGSYTDEGLQACTEACDSAGFTTAEVEEYLSLGCSEAVSAVSGESSGGSGGGADCKGCVWDGSSCTYYSDQYGSASTGYSWAAISCDGSCCQ